MLRPWWIAAALALSVPLPALGAGCDFNTARLSFAGSPAEQAACLLRTVDIGGRLRPQPAVLPTRLATKIGQEVTVSREAIRRHLVAQGLTEAALGGSLDRPVSRARNGAAGAPLARYFVIHDTSSPYLGERNFPAELDSDPSINNLQAYRAGGNAVAHLFVNRAGDTLVGHEFSVPWRATKLETTVGGQPTKGLFLHIELVQPRRQDPAVARRNDRLAPEPGFSARQYQRLALLYLMASRRAGTWLIPAFHATIDEGLPDGHDDPQRFSLETFDTTLGQLLDSLP